MAERHSNGDGGEPPLFDDPLDNLIETERGRLMAAENILACVIHAMSEDADMGDIWFPDVLEAAREKLHASINALDSVERSKLKPKKKRQRRKPPRRKAKAARRKGRKP